MIDAHIETYASDIEGVGRRVILHVNADDGTEIHIPFTKELAIQYGESLIRLANYL